MTKSLLIFIFKTGFSYNAIYSPTVSATVSAGPINSNCNVSMSNVLQKNVGEQDHVKGVKIVMETFVFPN